MLKCGWFCTNRIYVSLSAYATDYRTCNEG